MLSLIKRFFSAEGLVGKHEREGELPTSKSLYKNLMAVAWPATLEAVLVGLVSFIDTMMVSGLGSSAVASVGLTNQPKYMLYAVFFALNISATAIISRRKGQEDRESANKTLAQALSLCIILAILLCGLGIIIAKPFMMVAGANSDTLEGSSVYFRIVMIGMLFMSVSGVINSAQRAIGKTRIAMYSNLTANLVNICFNYLLITGKFGFPALGVAGAAIATMIGNIVACIMSCASVTKKDGYLRLKIKELFRFSSDILRPIVKVGLGAGVEQIFIRIGFFVYATIVANLGTTAFATHQICMNIINLSFTFGDGLGTASSALVGQNLGKKRRDLALIYGKAGQRVGFFVSLALILLFIFGGKMLMSLFTDPAENDYSVIISNGIKILYIIAACSPAQISQVIYSGCLRGAGDTKYVAMTSFISIGVVRPFLAYMLCFPLGLGIIGAWISLIIDQYTRLIFSATRFSSGKWCRIKL